MPSVYYDATQLRYVYYMPNKDYNWVPMALNGNNDIQAWGNMGTVQLDGFGVMLCTSPAMSASALPSTTADPSPQSCQRATGHNPNYNLLAACSPSSDAPMHRGR
jgi:hypothetical protein